MLSASLILTSMFSPTMKLFVCDSFERIPISYGKAVLAMGDTLIALIIVGNAVKTPSSLLVSHYFDQVTRIADTIIELQSDSLIRARGRA